MQSKPCCHYKLKLNPDGQFSKTPQRDFEGTEGGLEFCSYMYGLAYNEGKSLVIFCDDGNFEQRLNTLKCKLITLNESEIARLRRLNDYIEQIGG